MATRVKGDTIVQTVVEFGVVEEQIPGAIIEVDDEDEASLIKLRNTGIKKMQRKIYLGEWVEVD